MLDDLPIFFIAMTILKMTGITTKYARIYRFFNKLIILFIGLILIFRLEWLIFE